MFLLQGPPFGWLCTGPTDGFEATSSGQRMSLKGRERPVANSGCQQKPMGLAANAPVLLPALLPALGSEGDLRGQEIE